MNVQLTRMLVMLILVVSTMTLDTHVSATLDLQQMRTA